MPSIIHDPQTEPTAQFEQRKRDHIRLSLESENEALGGSGLDRIQLLHDAFPELDFSDINFSQTSAGLELRTPFLVSSMTAGHYDSVHLNRLLAETCEARGWMMGVGSQRRELDDQDASSEWREIRASAPKVKLLGNLGLSQLIHTSTDQVKKLVDVLEASAMIIHTNPLQECLQPEGTPQFRGGLEAISRLVRDLDVPVVIKETGCGFSVRSLERIKGLGVAAVDMSGYGGTHWGRIEGRRAPEGDIRQQVAESFSSWGISTIESLLAAVELKPDYAAWASGGVRSGRDAAGLLAMGAQVVGLAKPILQAALQGEEVLHKVMETFEYELKTAMFCTGCATISDLQEKNVWQWRKM